MSDTNQAIRDVVKGAGVVYVGLFVELLIALVAQILAARYLSVGGFGGLTTGTAILDIGSIVAGLGLASGLTRYLPRVDETDKRSLATTAVIVTIVTSLAVGLTITLNASFIAAGVFGDPEVAPSVRIFGAVIPFSALLNVAVGGIRGQKRSLYRVYVMNIVHPVTRFALVVVAVVYGLEQAGIASAYAIPYVVSSVLALILLYRSLPRSPISIDADLTTEVASYSLPFTVTNVASFVYRSIDIFLVLHYLGSFAVGVYGVAYAATSFMGMFSTAFNFLGAPVASELEHGGDVDGVMRVFRSVARWLVVGSICAFVPLGVFSTEFITIVYKSKYASGGIVLTILAAGFGAKNVLSIHGPILEALGRSRILAINSILAAVANVVLNVLLIPSYGVAGAAFATVLAFLLRDGLAAAQVRYLLGTTPLSWQGIGPAVVAVPFLLGLVQFVVPSVPTTLPWLIGVSGVFSVLYGCSVLLVFGLSETELMILRSTEERYGISLEPFEPIIQFLADR